jgi:hypothetical protein
MLCERTAVTDRMTIEPFTALEAVYIVHVFAVITPVIFWGGEYGRCFESRILCNRTAIPNLSAHGGRSPKEASREKDPEKVQKLAEELERALDQRRKRMYPDADK